MNTDNTKKLFHAAAQENISTPLPPMAKKVQYMDMSKVKFLNNSIIVSLINQSKAFYNKGIELKFTNVPEFLKRAIKKLGLDDVINCS